MIGQYLPQTNESVTVAKSNKFLYMRDCVLIKNGIIRDCEGNGLLSRSIIIENDWSNLALIGPNGKATKCTSTFKTGPWMLRSLHTGKGKVRALLSGDDSYVALRVKQMKTFATWKAMSPYTFWAEGTYESFCQRTSVELYINPKYKCIQWISTNYILKKKVFTAK